MIVVDDLEACPVEGTFFGSNHAYVCERLPGIFNAKQSSLQEVILGRRNEVDRPKFGWRQQPELPEDYQRSTNYHKHQSAVSKQN